MNGPYQTIPISSLPLLFVSFNETYHVDERSSIDPPLFRTAGSDPFILILAVGVDDLFPRKSQPSPPSPSWIRQTQRAQCYFSNNLQQYEQENKG